MTAAPEMFERTCKACSRRFVTPYSFKIYCSGAACTQNRAKASRKALREAERKAAEGVAT